MGTLCSRIDDSVVFNTIPSPDPGRIRATNSPHTSNHNNHPGARTSDQLPLMGMMPGAGRGPSPAPGPAPGGGLPIPAHKVQMNFGGATGQAPGLGSGASPLPQPLPVQTLADVMSRFGPSDVISAIANGAIPASSTSTSAKSVRISMNTGQGSLPTSSTNPLVPFIAVSPPSSLQLSLQLQQGQPGAQRPQPAVAPNPLPLPRRSMLLSALEMKDFKPPEPITPEERAHTGDFFTPPPPVLAVRQIKLYYREKYLMQFEGFAFGETAPPSPTKKEFPLPDLEDVETSGDDGEGREEAASDESKYPQGTKKWWAAKYRIVFANFTFGEDPPSDDESYYSDDSWSVDSEEDFINSYFEALQDFKFGKEPPEQYDPFRGEHSAATNRSSQSSIQSLDSETDRKLQLKVQINSIRYGKAHGFTPRGEKGQQQTKPKTAQAKAGKRTSLETGSTPEESFSQSSSFTNYSPQLSPQASSHLMVRTSVATEDVGQTTRLHSVFFDPNPHHVIIDQRTTSIPGSTSLPESEAGGGGGNTTMYKTMSGHILHDIQGTLPTIVTNRTSNTNNANSTNMFNTVLSDSTCGGSTGPLTSCRGIT